MTSPLDDVEFLARSENRLAILEALDSTPTTRRELQPRSGVERVTTGRILDAFIERGWAKNSNEGYELTVLGEMVSDAFEDVLATFETTQNLEPIVQWLPTDRMEFDLRRLGAATITLPSRSDPAAPTRRAGERLLDTTDVRIIMSVIVAEVVEACWRATRRGDQTLEAVFTPGVVETIAADESMARRVGEMVELDNVRVYVCEEQFPYIMGLLDEIVAFGVTDEENLPRSYLEVQDPIVRRWVETTYESYRDRSTQIDGDDLRASSFE